ncbi:MAG: hypothetical protein ICV60_03700 [Pyrinomonadaceae bacterium]|nr:hypothetical protein [Pyrinomonadaceae bacterium]
MSTKEKKLFFPTLILIVAAIALTLISVRAGTVGFDWAKPPVPVPTPLASASRQDAMKSMNDLRARLARQPAAFKLALRLGKRFRSTGRAESVLVGTLRRGAEEKSVRITRRQTEDGERVEVALGNGPASLTWSAKEGALSSGSPATAGDRLLLERLVLDTPDQFVLAQLRGASYQTIARGVRPENAGDEYSGPVWDIVQVKETANEASSGAQSAWRLYWINASTGVIDKIVSLEDSVEVTATLSGWTEQRGELMPSAITWTSRGETLMRLVFNGFDYSEQQSR